MNNKLFVGIAVGAAALAGIVGGSSLNAIQANAQDTQIITAQTQAPQGQTAGQVNPGKGGHVGSNGKREEILTGDTAEKAKTAALAANPGGIIQRVETDAEGAAYEAHMTKSDGSQVTVKLDTNFNVTSNEAGMH